MWFADDTEALAEKEQELEVLVESLDKTCTRCTMEIGAKKTKLMTNRVNGIQKEIKVTGQKLDTIKRLKTAALKDCPSYCSFDKAEDNLERYQHICWIKVKLIYSLAFPYFCMPVNHGP